MASTGPKTATSDLSALRIDDSKRGGRPVAKWIGIGVALVLIVVAALGAGSALRNRKPEVEVAAAISPRARGLPLC